MSLLINLNSVIINEAAPVVAKPISIAWMLGCSDAECSRPVFSPETFFVRLEDKIQYSLGYEAVLGASEMTRQFTGSVQL